MIKYEEKLRDLMSKVPPELQIFIDEQKDHDPEALYFLFGILKNISYTLQVVGAYDDNLFTLVIEIGNGNGFVIDHELGKIHPKDLPPFMWETPDNLWTKKQKRHLQTIMNPETRSFFFRVNCGGGSGNALTLKSSNHEKHEKCKRCLKYVVKNEIEVEG